MHISFLSIPPAAGAVGGVCALGLLLMLAIIGVALAKCYKARQKTNNEYEGVCVGS